MEAKTIATLQRYVEQKSRSLYYEPAATLRSETEVLEKLSAHINAGATVAELYHRLAGTPGTVARDIRGLIAELDQRFS